MSGRWWLRTHKNIHCLLFTIKPYDFHRFHSEKVDIEAGKKNPPNKRWDTFTALCYGFSTKI